MKKTFKKGTEFELYGFVFTVTDVIGKWINYECKYGTTPNPLDTMAFMSMSTNWQNANILK